MHETREDSQLSAEREDLKSILSRFEQNATEQQERAEAMYKGAGIGGMVE
jgi:hypothetical protein